MRMTGLFLAAAAIVAAPAMAQPATSPADYVMKAGAGDLYEKTSSQTVLMTTKDPAVKKFANMMVMDHNQSTAKVKAAAMKDGLKPKPPMLMADQQQMISELKAAKGADRDHLYISQQKTAHQKALALHSDYAQNGTAPALKTAAAGITPVVQMHLDMLNKM